MKNLKITAFVLFVAFLPATQAQENSAEEKLGRVEIRNTRDPELRSYAQMLKGIKIYYEKKQLAPDSELYFILIPKSNRFGLEGLTFRLASDETSMNIPIASDGRFQLPLIELKSDDEYDLILNRPKGQFRIRPFVKSRDLSDDVKRLGDLRLECQVRWAIEKQDVSLVFSAYVKLLASGTPCMTRTVDVGFYAPSGVDLITLAGSKSKLSFGVDSDGRYSVPLWNNELSDDFLLKYERLASSTSK